MKILFFLCFCLASCAVPKPNYNTSHTHNKTLETRSKVVKKTDLLSKKQMNKARKSASKYLKPSIKNKKKIKKRFI